MLLSCKTNKISLNLQSCRRAPGLSETLSPRVGMLPAMNDNSTQTAATPCDISVVIPLYNKAAEIGRAVRSVLAQTLPPREVIVVDDGSTDGSAAVVEAIASPLVRLVRQENRGVSAARNRGIAMASGRHVALLDGDDSWHPEYLGHVTALIARYPDCGAYGTGFMVDTDGRRTVGDTPREEGVVDFFRESMTRYVLIPSAATLRRDLVMDVGGFPEGMRMGEDQWLWTVLARPRPRGLHAATAGRIFAHGIQPLGRDIPSRADLAFAIRTIRPCGRGLEQRIHRPRGSGQGPRAERGGRYRFGGRGAAPLLLQPSLAPHSAQGACP